MKTRLIAFLLLATLLLTAVGCTVEPNPTDTLPEATAPDTTAEPDTPAETQPETTVPETETETEPETEPPAPPELDKSKTYNILFIGNSYTYYGSMPTRYFEGIMKAAGYKVRVISVTKGGWTLLGSSRSSDELGRQVEAVLANTKFDFVVMQEQSTTPVDNIGSFYSGVKGLDKKIRDNGATPILYATWGRKSGSSTLTSMGLTNETMTWRLAAAYATIGKRLDIPVAHVGLAFRDIVVNQPRVELYDPDLSHPSEAGSYLAALTIFARITGVDPTTVDFDGGVGSKIDPIIKEAARKAVFETPEIPEEYLAKAERQNMPRS